MAGFTPPQTLSHWFSKSGSQTTQKLAGNADSQATLRPTESKIDLIVLSVEPNFYISQMILKFSQRTSLVVHWLTLCALNAGGPVGSLVRELNLACHN